MRVALALLVFLGLMACPSDPAGVGDDAGVLPSDGGGGGTGGGTGGGGGGTGGGGAFADGGSLPLDAGVSADGGLLPHAPLPAAASVQHERFATGLVCGQCHSVATGSQANRDEQGTPIGLYELWSASPMANAARDPLFRAAVAGEIARAPDAGTAIAGVCLNCHSGMGTHALTAAGGTVTLGLVYAATNEGTLARDGVSCALCHQMEGANFRQDSSFSGNYQLNTSRFIYGPYAAPFTMPMVNDVQYTPREGAHLGESAMCGTCHALVTEAVTPEGAGTGHRMGEQLTYLEWRRSAFSTEGGGTTPTSCQSCHMPDRQADGGVLMTRLAHKPNGTDFNPIGPRGPYSRHTFAGANTLLPRLLRQGRALLNPPASDAALTASEQVARDALRTQSARLTVQDAQQAGAALAFSVKVENLVGHKFPSGYPSRRAFLHVRVLDAAGAVLFETGATDAEGRLLGPDGQPLGPERRGGGFHPHRDQVTSSAEAVVWESVMDDGHGAPSYALLGAEGYVKDNRLLPLGHQDTTTGPMSTAPVGVTDADFVGGADVVHFALASAPAAARIEARLRYQTMSPRYLDELLVRSTPEAEALRGMLQPGTLAPELVDEATVTLP